MHFGFESDLEQTELHFVVGKDYMIGSPLVAFVKGLIVQALTDKLGLIVLSAYSPRESLSPCRGLWATLHTGGDIDCNTCLLWEC